MVKDLDNWKTGGSVEGVFDVSYAEEDRKQECECHGTIDDDGPDQNSRNSNRRITDFFTHMDGPVEA